MGRHLAILLAVVLSWVVGVNAAEEKRLRGTLDAAPAGAAEGVVAVLKVANKENPKDSRTYTLVATAESKEKLAKLVAQKAKVDVTGTLDGETMTVSKVTDPAAAKKDPKKAEKDPKKAQKEPAKEPRKAATKESKKEKTQSTHKVEGAPFEF